MLPKDFKEELGTTISTSMALTTFFIFPLCVYYYLRSTRALAQELNCGDVVSMLDNPECDDLAKIAIMNVGTASADGFFVMGLVLAALGSACFVSAKHVYRHCLPSVVQAAEPLSVPLLEETASESSDAGSLLPAWMSRVNTISQTAAHWRRVGLGVGVITSLPYMLLVGQRILANKGCDDSFIGLMWRGPIDVDACPTLVTYYAMMSFSYPWTVSTWSAYIGWELSVLYQVLPIKRCWRVPSVDLGWLTARLPHFFTQELKNHAVFWFKLVGLVTFLGASYPVLKDGIGFADDALREYGCPGFFTTVFSQQFINSPTCAPVFQILGVDAGVLKAEVYNAYPIIMCAGLIALLLTGLVSTPVVYHAGDNPKLKKALQWLNEQLTDALQAGHRVGSAFLLVATLGFFMLAIPKANNLLDLAGCPMLHYPSFAYFFDERCSAMTRSQANMVFLSMMWVIVSTSAIGLGTAGVLGHVTYRSSTAVARLFQRSGRGYQALPAAQESMPDNNAPKQSQV